MQHTRLSGRRNRQNHNPSLNLYVPSGNSGLPSQFLFIAHHKHHGYNSLHRDHLRFDLG
ncbi:hypothetical protein LINPERPRIM_LOCUS23230 [Linum perenne]